jgi:hypothetical protein
MSEFLVLLEKQYDVSIPDWILGGQGRTLTQLAAYIEAEIARKSA